MTITIVGAGYVGLTSAVVYAELGHTVYLVRRDQHKLEQLKRGQIDIYEPGLADAVANVLARGALKPTLDFAAAVSDSSVVMICVGTPPRSDGSADLSQVFEVAQTITPHLRGYTVVANKSTVPVGTGERVEQIIIPLLLSGAVVDVASCPEFLREGTALDDLRHPDRIVIGTDSIRARSALLELHQSLPGKRVVTDRRSAELIKYSSNAFLATKISFINEIANLCDEVGANVEDVAYGMGLDPRIGSAFLKAGIGYGGSCLAGDERVFLRTREGMVLRLTIQQAVRQFQSGELPAADILCLDQKKKAVGFSSIKTASERFFHGPLVLLKTKMGRTLRLTADHPCLVWEDGVIRKKLAGALVKNDQLLLSTELPEAVAPNEIDLISALQHSEEFNPSTIKCRPLTKKLSDIPNIRTLLRQQVGRLKSYGGREDDIIASNCLTLNEFLTVERSLAPIIQRRDLVLFTTRGSTTYCPALFPLTAETSRLIGYYISEGHIHYEKKGGRARMQFSFNKSEKEYLDDVAAILNRLSIRFDRRKSGSTEVIVVSSRIFSYFVDTLLGCGKNSYSARIPDFFFGAPKQFRWELLKGIVRGDGHMAFPKHSPAVVMDFGCGSKELSDGMVELFQSIGIVSSTKRSRSQKSTVWAHFVRVSGEQQVRQLLDFKDQRTAQHILDRLRMYKKHIQQTGFKRINDHLAHVSVRSLTTMIGRLPVYSFEVNPKKTFVTSGGLIVHNCFPKDTQALHSIALEHDYEFKLLKAVIEVNQAQRRQFIRKIKKTLGEVRGKTIGVLGLAFKAQTDDVRQSAALDVIRWLGDQGSRVKAYDPQAEQRALEQIPALTVCSSAEEVFDGVNAVLVLTEWPEFRALPWAACKERMASPIVLDGRNVLDARHMHEMGFRYYSVGRP